MTPEKSSIRVKRVSPDQPATTARRAAAPRAAASAPAPAPAPEHTAPHDASPQLPATTAHHPRETKPFYLTSEFLLAAATIAGLLIFGSLHDDDSLNNWRTWLLVAVVASAYIVSRGIAKAGSSDRR